MAEQNQERRDQIIASMKARLGDHYEGERHEHFLLRAVAAMFETATEILASAEGAREQGDPAQAPPRPEANQAVRTEK